MSRLSPYLELALTVAVLAFLAFIVAGGFNRPADDIVQAVLHPNH